ncbi:MAG: helix-turn-helix domain-containing protein [Dehalococcoidia bacterium]
MLQRARQARGLTLEEVERDTRISRRYLEALENENFGLLPAPVYARGFLRTYARYLGLEPSNLLPLFPVGYVEEPVLQPWPKVKTPRTWPSSGLLAAAVVGVLIIIVIAVYSLGGQGESSSHSLFGFQSATPATTVLPAEEPPVVAPPVTETVAPPAEVPAGAMPDLRAQLLADAAATLRDMGVSYLVVQVNSDAMPAGHVVRQSPAPGSDIPADQPVILEVSRGP